MRRLQQHRDTVLAFMYDSVIPFTNNFAERDFRMMKVKQKIFGPFRSELGKKIFSPICGNISTARKNGIRIFDAIKIAIEGKPFTSIANHTEQ